MQQRAVGRSHGRKQCGDCTGCGRPPELHVVTEIVPGSYSRNSAMQRCHPLLECKTACRSTMGSAGEFGAGQILKTLRLEQENSTAFKAGTLLDALVRGLYTKDSGETWPTGLLLHAVERAEMRLQRNRALYDGAATKRALNRCRGPVEIGRMQPTRTARGFVLQKPARAAGADGMQKA